MDVWRSPSAVLIGAALLAFVPAVATAHEQPAHLSPALKKALGPAVERLSSGKLEVDPAVGPPLVTHGPDTRGEMLSESELATNSVFTPGAAERNPVCATDYYEHVIYAYPASGTSRYASVVDDLRAQIRRNDAVLNTSSLLSGGGTADLKVLCDGSGEIRIDPVPVSGTSFNSVVSSLRSAGFNSSRADYTIFLDVSSSSYCGVGSFSSDESLSVSNANNTGGDYGISYSGCWYSRTSMHENGHNMGAVQAGAPHSTGNGAHCNQDYDVMCYSPDGGNRNQGGDVLVCADAIYYDCGFDDYFNSAPQPGSYLASHWNIGSPLNRFVSFGAGGGSPPPPPPPGGGGSTGGGSGAGPAVNPVVPTGGSNEPVAPSVQRLRFGRLVRGTAAQEGSFTYYRVRLPAGARRIALRGVAGTDLDLYVRRAGLPSDARYACASRGPGSIERCTLYPWARGTWFAGVLTESGSGLPFVIRAR